MEKNWLPPGQAPSARISPVRLSSLSRALLEGARTKTASSTTMGVPMLANQPEPYFTAHFSSISAAVRGVLASVTPGEPDWPRNWGKSRGESAVMAEEAPVPAAPAAADGRQAAPAATASASSALNKRFFSCMGLHPFFAGRVVPPVCCEQKREPVSALYPAQRGCAPLRLGAISRRNPACPGVRQVSWLEFHLLAFRLPRGYPVTEAPAWPGLPESFRPSHSSGGCRGFAPRSLFIRAAPESPERRGTVRRYSILFHRPL